MKEELRKKYKIIRKQVIDKEIKSEIIEKKLIKTKEFINAKIVGVYISLKDEVNTNEIIKECFKINKKVAIPKVLNEHIIEFYTIKENEKLQEGLYHIMEPNNKNIISKDDIDLMIIPGICFDKQKNRIGYGKGYYDTYLKNTKIYKIGICFNEQLMNEHEIKVEENDIKLDKIITDKKVIL